MKLFILSENVDFAVDAVRWCYDKSNIEEITLCKSSEEFIPKIGDLHMDMVFIELGNPNIPGMEIAQCIRGVSYESKVVFISNIKEFVMDAFEMGAFNYLITPVKKQSFDKLIGMAS